MKRFSTLTDSELNCQLRNIAARLSPYHGRHDQETKQALTNEDALRANEQWKWRTGEDHECVKRWILDRVPKSQ